MEERTRVCPLCGAKENITGKGKYRDDIGEYEWYESDHKCPKVNDAAKALGQLGGLMTKKKHGKEHYQRLAQNMNKKLGRKH